MAVEKIMGAGGEMSPEAVLDEQIEILEGIQTPGQVELNDGSMLVGEITEDMLMQAAPVEIPFDANLADFMDESVLGAMASDIVGDIEDDMSSRQEWEDNYKRGIELLGMTYEERSQPFEGATGVVHPLLAESVTQFQAQAYRELLPAGGPVRTQIIGEESKESLAQADRVKNYMNYQITYEMEEYDPELDQMLFYLPLTGSTFKKVYFDPLKQRAVSQFIHAEDLVVPYSATDLATSPRVTHIIKMDKNEILKLQLAGFYSDVDLPGEGYGDEDYSEVQESIDEAQGVKPVGNSEELTLYEVHTELDLEGFEDMGPDGEPTGLKLPYILTICEKNGKVLSIRRNYDQADALRRKKPYFVHYKFLPGLGFLRLWPDTHDWWPLCCRYKPPETAYRCWYVV
jgi:hypothetical protein